MKVYFPPKINRARHWRARRLFSLTRATTSCGVIGASGASINYNIKEFRLYIKQDFRLL